MSARRLLLTIPIALCALVAMLALAAVSAFAEISHRYETQLTGASPSEAFVEPWGLAFDSTGSLFVADARRKAVDVFDSANAFISPQLTSSAFELEYTRGVAVATAGDLYVAESGPVNIDVFKPEGSHEYGLVEASNFGNGYLYVAVDNHPAGPADPRAGDVYVLAGDRLHVIKPGPEGRLEGQGEEVAHLGGFGTDASGSAGLTVDGATGNVYVADPVNGVVDVFNNKGEEQPLLAITGSGTPAGAASFAPIAVAVDAVAEVVYVVDGANHVVDEFSEAGAWLGQIRQTTSGNQLGEPLGVAVQEHPGPTRGDVYVSDGANGVVDVFGAAGVVLPSIVTGAVSGLTATSVTLSGTVDPAEVPVSACRFEYGTATEATFTHSVSCSSLPGSGNAAVPVSAVVSGLDPAKRYAYRLAAANVNGTNYGVSTSFETPPAVEGVNTGPAEGVTQSAAMLTGSLSPDGTDTHYYFQYGTSTDYGSTSPALPGTDAGTGGPGCAPPGGPQCGAVSAEAALASLTANTTYHYRLVAVNEFGSTAGAAEVLKTLGPPQVRSESEIKPNEQAGQTTATLQAQIDPDGRATTYRFEYGETTSYGTVSPIPDGAVGSGEEFTAVPAVELNALKIGTTYHYRVVATNEYGTTKGPDQEFRTLPAALVEQSVSEVAATSATLKAQINPLGRDTTYYFQYGTSANYSDSVPAPPGADIGTGESSLSVSVHLQSLAAGTTYHYRVVAVNEPNGVFTQTAGADGTFTTQATGSELTLPDGRAWEMVSPPNKQGAAILAVGYNQGSAIQSAADGGAMTYTATAPFVANPAGSRSIETTQVISARHAPGSWETSDITLPHNNGATQLAVGHSAEYKLFSTDLSLGFVEPADNTPLPPLPPNAERTIYLRGPNGEYKALVTAENVPPGAKFGNAEGGDPVNLAGASPDLKHLVLTSKVKLTATPRPSGAGQTLYEWTEGQLQVVSILPDGEPTTAVLGDGNVVVRHAVSDDGSRVVWERSDGHLYLRDTAKGETIQIDAAQGTPEPELGQLVYRTANAQGSRVFFTSSRRLTADSTAGLEDLYVFEVTSADGQQLAGRLTDLTVDGNAGEGAGVKNVTGASEEGSYVYFLARAILGDGAEHGAASGGNNLYVEHYDSNAKTWMAPIFIAALSEADSPSWGGAALPDLKYMTSRVSPNGRYLAFMSDRSLTGYENRDASSGAADEEVFLYDASTGRLACASCNPTGARPTGSLMSSVFEANLVDYSDNWNGRWLAGNIPGWTTTDLGIALYQSRYLSDSGRLFFNSSDALVPGDVNGTEDVYEYEAASTGSCQGPTHGQSASVVFEQGVDGCVGLISSGTSSEESAFMDASETGGDVFFLTLSRLVAEDHDTSIDLYDAHECSAAELCAPPVALGPPACATGDACKASPTPQPALFGAPSSETFSGAGNVAPPASESTATHRSLSRAQKLTKALKACRKTPKHKRAGCERQARKKYGAKESRRGKNLSARTRR